MYVNCTGNLLNTMANMRYTQQQNQQNQGQQVLVISVCV